MALSNIFREPRREIVESLVGVVLVVALVAADYFVAVLLASVLVNDHGVPLPIPLGMGAGLFLFVFIGGFLVATHALGDAVCNVLEDRGVHLRPRVRR